MARSDVEDVSKGPQGVKPSSGGKGIPRVVDTIVGCNQPGKDLLKLTIPHPAIKTLADSNSKLSEGYCWA